MQVESPLITHPLSQQLSRQFLQTSDTGQDTKDDEPSWPRCVVYYYSLYVLAQVTADPLGTATSQPPETVISTSSGKNDPLITETKPSQSQPKVIQAPSNRKAPSGLFGSMSDDDDMFSSKKPAEPAAAPTEIKKPSAASGLFGSLSDDEDDMFSSKPLPSTKPIEAPAPVSQNRTPSGLFGSLSDDDMFSSKAPAATKPIETCAAPIIQKPTPSGLFGSLSDEDILPSKPVSKTPAANDLFGSPSSDSDMFGSTSKPKASQPEPAATKTSDPLFGSPSSDDDLFGSKKPLVKPSETAPTPANTAKGDPLAFAAIKPQQEEVSASPILILQVLHPKSSWDSGMW